MRRANRAPGSSRSIARWARWKVTQQNAALVEEAAAAAHSLRDQAEALRDAVTRFALPA